VVDDLLTDVPTAGADVPLETAEAVARQHRRAASPWPDLWRVLDEVPDPEIPSLSIWELGILQDVQVWDDGVTVCITPTYSGCPAMRVIAEDIVAVLQSSGYSPVSVQTRLSPVWTSDWLTREAKQKLRAAGISSAACTHEAEVVNCPRCDSPQTRCISAYSGTACKAMYRCSHCFEVFDHFKSH
jgi:ring-1,2-phenylacetyl-CoA epoxidase subunit PaaD